jgi:hypothetical protein
MPLKKSRWFVSAVCISLLAVGSAARAEGNSSIEPRAERILKAAIGHLEAAKSFKLRGELNNEIQLPSGERIEYASVLQAAVRRPDRAWTRVEGELRQGSNSYDGKTLTHLELGGNAYAVWPAPPTIDELLDAMKEKLGFLPPLSNIMRQKLEQEVFTGLQSGVYIGEAVVRGSKCSHLAFRQENIDLQVWVDNGVPVIRRIVITYKKLPGVPQYGVTFTEWEFNTTLPDSVFAFDPPPGATRVEFEIVKP